MLAPWHALRRLIMAGRGCTSPAPLEAHVIQFSRCIITALKALKPFAANAAVVGLSWPAVAAAAVSLSWLAVAAAVVGLSWPAVAAAVVGLSWLAVAVAVIGLSWLAVAAAGVGLSWPAVATAVVGLSWPAVATASLRPPNCRGPSAIQLGSSFHGTKKPACEGKWVQLSRTYHLRSHAGLQTVFFHWLILAKIFLLVNIFFDRFREVHLRHPTFRRYKPVTRQPSASIRRSYQQASSHILLPFSVAFTTASMTVCLKPPFSRASTASMVVPFGDVTISFSSPG